ncbi:MAG TPA: hypothetical protein V6D10_19170 [Trichocoleus sp.]
MNSKSPKIQFPVWQYLNQPILDPKHPLILNPHRFWRRHQIRYLERCWYSSHPEEHFRN